MELLIVLAIAVGLIGVMGVGIKRLRSSDLRTASSELAGAIKFTYDRAVATGKYYRLVIDIESKRFYPEVSDERFYLLRDRDRGRRPIDEQDDSDQPGGALPTPRPAAGASGGLGGLGGLLGGLGGGGGAGAGGTGQAPKVGTGKPRFAAETQGPNQSQPKKQSAPLKGVTIAGVWTPRQNEPITQGRAYLYFYPEGMGERAIIYLADQAGTTFSLVAHPLTGRVQITDQRVDIPRDGERDDEGQERE
jgi:general secretion pathway protein H